MKKIYTLLAVCLSFAATAQNDLVLTLDNYTDGASISDDPILLDFTITNNGGTISSGDTIYWAYTVGTDYYSTIDLAGPGYVTYTVLSADFNNGDSFGVDGADIPMSWAYDQGGLNPTICAVVAGVGAVSLSSVWDATPTDNKECVDYTVTSVAGIDVQSDAVGKVYITDNNVLKIENANGSFDATANIQIMNISGQTVQATQTQLEGSVADVQLNELSTGIYLATIEINGNVVTKKFAVK